MQIGVEVLCTLKTTHKLKGNVCDEKILKQELTVDIEEMDYLTVYINPSSIEFIQRGLCANADEMYAS